MEKCVSYRGRHCIRKLLSATMGHSIVVANSKYLRGSGVPPYYIFTELCAGERQERVCAADRQVTKNAINSSGDFHLALLNYRITAIEGLSSHAQLFMGRRLVSKLPVHLDLLKAQPINYSE